MDFCSPTIDLLRKCVESCWFFVLINCQLTGHFHPIQGLRQGGPLSSSLFILAAEYLSPSLDSIFTTHPAMYFNILDGCRSPTFSMLMVS